MPLALTSSPCPVCYVFLFVCCFKLKSEFVVDSLTLSFLSGHCNSSLPSWDQTTSGRRAVCKFNVRLKSVISFCLKQANTFKGI